MLNIEKETNIEEKEIIINKILKKIERVMQRKGRIYIKCSLIIFYTKDSEILITLDIENIKYVVTLTYVALKLAEAVSRRISIDSPVDTILKCYKIEEKSSKINKRSIIIFDTLIEHILRENTLKLKNKEMENMQPLYDALTRKGTGTPQ